MRKQLILFLLVCSFFNPLHGDIVWDPPQSFATPLNSADLAVGNRTNGIATAVWREESGGISSIYYAMGSGSFPFGGVQFWLTLGVLSSLKFDSNDFGLAVAAWIEDGQVRAAVDTNGGGFPANFNMVLSTDSGGATCSQPSVAIDQSSSNPTILVCWKEGASTFSNIKVSRYFNGVWDATPTLLASSGNNPDVDVVNISTGFGAVVWHNKVLSTENIQSRTLENISTNSWGAAKDVFPLTSSTLCDYPKVVIDNRRNANAAWFRYNVTTPGAGDLAYQNVQVCSSLLDYYTASSNSTTWGPVQVLSKSGIRNPADLKLKIKFDGYNNAIAAWTNSYDGMLFNIESAQRAYENNQWRLYTIPYLASLYSFGMDLSSYLGNSLLTNMQWDGTTVNIQSQESATGDPLIQAWSGVNIISSGIDNAYPSCSLSSGSSIWGITVWYDYDSNTGVNLMYSFGSEALVAPPTNVNVVQSTTTFNFFTDYYNTITWTASTEPNIMQYNIFRNGIYIGSTNSATLTYEDHNQKPADTTTIYAVAVVTTTYRQSALVTDTI